MEHHNRFRSKTKNSLMELRQEPERVYCLALYVVLFFSFYYLFVNQARGFFRSDLTYHIIASLRNGSYSINGFFLKISHKLAGNYGCAAYLTLVVFLTILVTAFFLKEEINRNLSDHIYGWAKSLLIAASLFFLGGIYVPNVYPYFYLAPNYSGPGSASSICTQPWQNSTYLLMRFFGLITIMLFFRIHRTYLSKGISLKEWLLFTIFLTLTNAAKPNFFIAFAPAMLIILIWDFIKQKGHGFWRMVVFGTGVLCSMPVLFIQKSMLFPDAAVTIIETKQTPGIEFTTNVIQKMYRDGIILPYLITGLLFFIIITILCIKYRELKSELIFGWIMQIIALLESWFIIETGKRATAGNFAWGVPFFAFIMSFICIERLIKIKTRIEKPIYPFVVTPLVLMLITGLAYFAHLLGGGDFIA